MKSCYWYKEEICAEKRKGVPIVETREERGMWVYIWTIEEEIY